MKDYDIQVNILRRPTSTDWERCKDLAMRTMGKKWTGDEVTEAWMHRMLECRHSPIRTLMFTIELIIPYYVSVHLVRHKFGIEHYVQSQRNDRQTQYDRELAPQNAMVSHTIDVNAEAVMQISEKRLCGMADPMTRYVWSRVCRAIEEVNPEFVGHLHPQCERLRHCPEHKPCGYWKKRCEDDFVEIAKSMGVELFKDLSEDIGEAGGVVLQCFDEVLPYPPTPSTKYWPEDDRTNSGLFEED